MAGSNECRVFAFRSGLDLKFFLDFFFPKTMFVLALLLVSLSVGVAQECRDWPELGDKFAMEIPFISAWRRYASVLQNGVAERSEAQTTMMKQCVSYNSDVEWISASDETVRFAATDMKLTLCGAEIRVRDCNDLDGKLLFVISSDTCLQARAYRITRCGPTQQDAAECMKNGKLEYEALPLYGVLSLRYLAYNFTVNYLGKDPVHYALADASSFFVRAAQVEVNTTTAAVLTPAQRREASGLFALLLTTRMFEKFDSNDTCSDFISFGIPVLVILGLVCCVIAVLAIRHRMTRA
jgi:hypothetical protein